MSWVNGGGVGLVCGEEGLGLLRLRSVGRVGGQGGWEGFLRVYVCI